MFAAEIVTRDKWLKARKALLVEEKEFNRQRDALSARRRELPWVEVVENYVFSGEDGDVSLGGLFGDHSQLIVYHFMYGPDWDEGCPSCSFWADNFDRITPHLAARDAAFAVIARAPYETLAAYKKRLGWGSRWVSSHDNGFNADFNVSFTEAQVEAGEAFYNYKKSTFPSLEAPGVSVFARKGDKIYHTYSTFARGIDMLNGAYHYMDLLPKGRDEDALEWPMAWLKRQDQY